MMAEKVKMDTFKPPLPKVKQIIQILDTGTSEPVSQKPYPIAMKHYKWVNNEISKLLIVKVIQESHSSWSASIIVVLKEDEGKHLVIDYHALNKVMQTFIWTMPKVEDIFSQLNEAKYFSTLHLWAGYHHIPLDEFSIPQTAFTSLFGKYEYIKVHFALMQAPLYFQELMTGVLKDFSFAITYLDDIIIISRTANTSTTLSKFSKNYRMHIYWWNLANATSSLKKSTTLDTSSAPQASDHYHQKSKP